MRAAIAWKQTGGEFNRTDDEIITRIEDAAFFGFAQTLFMEHEITGPQRNWLRKQGYVIKRSRERNKIEVSWEGKRE